MANVGVVLSSEFSFACSLKRKILGMSSRPASISYFLAITMVTPDGPMFF
jgi:hypothetical protein